MSVMVKSINLYISSSHSALKIGKCFNFPKLDHIAYRSIKSFGGLKRIEDSIEDMYIPKDTYDFPDRRVTGKWFAPKDPDMPIIFASELRDSELSGYTKKYIETLEYTKSDFEGTKLGNEMWGPIAYEEYNKIADESEYAAWTLMNGDRVNHIALAIHTTGSTLEETHKKLRKEGFTISEQGGEIKVSKDGLLKQSSIISDQYLGVFKDRMCDVSGGFVEFVERKRISFFSNKRREGFDVDNADKIFDSANRRSIFRRVV